MLGRNIHSGTQQHLKASVIPGLPEIELSLLDLGTFPLRPKASLPSFYHFCDPRTSTWRPAFSRPCRLPEIYCCMPSLELAAERSN